MKEIIIQKNEDFSKLCGLVGNEYIVLKISKELRNIKISAISLKKFTGTIHVLLEDPNCPVCVKILREKGIQTSYFFSDFKKAKILFPPNHRFDFQPINFSKRKLVFCEKDLKDAFSMASKTSGMNIYLKNDVCFSGIVPIMDSSTIVHGEGHIIYGRNQSLKSLLSSSIEMKDVSFEKVDCIFPITKSSDFDCISNYSTQKVLLSFRKNLANMVIKPMDLRSFYGTLIILGNGRTLDYVTFLDTKTNSIGLVSDLSLQASLVISDLSIKHIQFPSSQKDYVGCFLGKREDMQGPYYVMPGKTCFRHCKVSNTFVPSGSFCTGIFAGSVDEFADCYGCSTSYVVSPAGVAYFGNQYYYTLTNLASSKSTNVDYKRICFHRNDYQLIRKK